MKGIYKQEHCGLVLIFKNRVADADADDWSNAVTKILGAELDLSRSALLGGEHALLYVLQLTMYLARNL